MLRHTRERSWDLHSPFVLAKSSLPLYSSSDKLSKRKKITPRPNIRESYHKGSYLANSLMVWYRFTNVIKICRSFDSSEVQLDLETQIFWTEIPLKPSGRKQIWIYLFLQRSEWYLNALKRRTAILALWKTYCCSKALCLWSLVISKTHFFFFFFFIAFARHPACFHRATVTHMVWWAIWQRNA